MTSSKSTVLLEHHLKQLKLPTMYRDYQAVAAACGKENSDYATYLLRLTERELIEREVRAADRRIKAAGFGVIKMIDTFDFKFQPSINESLVKELLRGEYIDAHENVLLIGNSGTGKSHLATALSFAACAACAKTIEPKAIKTKNADADTRIILFMYCLFILTLLFVRQQSGYLYHLDSCKEAF